MPGSDNTHDDNSAPLALANKPSPLRYAPLVPQAHLTVVEQVNVYHQIKGEQPTALAPVAFSRALISDEQPFQREFKVGPIWQPLDSGWLDPADCSLLCLRNRPVSRTTRPTVEEAAAEAVLIIEVAVVLPAVFGDDREAVVNKPRRTMHDPKVDSGGNGGDDGAPSVDKVDLLPLCLIRPGEMLRFEPVDVSVLAVRCTAGEARASMALFPR